MKLLLNEVLQKISNAKTKAQKIKLLQEFNTPALRQVLIANFDDSIISMLPEGEVPYEKNEAPEETENERLHPEMYDEEGQWINEELLSVRFVDEDFDDE